MLSNLDKRDTAVLKALAIVAIVLHNFFHAVTPVQQNEFTFNPARFGILLQHLCQPQFAIQAFFAFFGHFGVQIFIFLSAFGLARSHWDTNESWLAFMKGRIYKLYPTFGLVVIPWFLVTCLQQGPMLVIRRMGLEIALMFVGLAAFLPGADLPPIGPWWFISFIVLFYAGWPLLRSFTQRFGVGMLWVLAASCLCFTFTVNPLVARWTINLLETPVGRMLPICFGITAARKNFRVSGPVAVVGAAVLVAGSRYYMLWPFTSFAALLVSLWLYMAVRDLLRRSDNLVRLGEYSLLVFLLNAIVRNCFVPFATTPGRQLGYGLVSTVVSFAIAAVIHEFLAPRPATLSQPVELARVS